MNMPINVLKVSTHKGTVLEENRTLQLPLRGKDLHQGVQGLNPDKN